MSLRRLAPALLVLAACGPTKLQNVNARLSFDPESLDFGSRPVLDDLTLKVHVTNLGQAPVTMKISLTGDSVFTLAGGESQLDGGGETDLSVNFNPTEQKTYAGKLVIDSDEQDENHHEIPLTGIGNTVAAATIDPTSLDFGRVGENRTKVLHVKITSVGTADLKIKTIDLKPGTNPAYGFVGSTRTPMMLAHHVDGTNDAYAEVAVKFAPTAATVGTDMTGTLILETSDPQNASVSIPLTAKMNQAPIADPGKDQQVAPGTNVKLDGSNSSDPDGDLPLTFKWTLSTKPQGSAAALVGDTTATPTLQTDQPGGYGVDLVVTDSAGLTSKTKRVNVTGVAADKLVIELVWDHPVADLDLHFLRPNDALNGPMDCDWSNPHPDWGVVGDPDDDPANLGDKLAGFGPEYVVYEQPPDGGYRMVVDYASANGAADTKLTATIRVYLYGVVVRELDHVMLKPGEVWNAGTVTWPTGAVATGAEGTP